MPYAVAARLALSLALAAGVASTAQAAIVNVTFTGTIYGVVPDLNGAVFGPSNPVQEGDIITGTIQVNTSLPTNVEPTALSAIWRMPSQDRPQPVSFLSSTFTINGVTISTDTPLGQPNSHAADVVDVDNYNPDGSILDDSLTYIDNSSRLMCSDPQNGIGCIDVALAETNLAISFESWTDFLLNTGLEQTVSLDSAAIDGMTANASRASGYYRVFALGENFETVASAQGEFYLTSLNISLANETPVGTPEPASLALFGLALAGLAAARRRAA